MTSNDLENNTKVIVFIILHTQQDKYLKFDEILLMSANISNLEASVSDKQGDT